MSYTFFIVLFTEEGVAMTAKNRLSPQRITIANKGVHLKPRTALTIPEVRLAVENIRLKGADPEQFPRIMFGILFSRLYFRLRRLFLLSRPYFRKRR